MSVFGIVLQLAGITYAPQLLSFFANRINPPPNKKPPPNYPQSTFDHAVRAMLLAMAVFHIASYLFLAPSNILGVLQVAPEDPLRLLTTRMRSYAGKKWNESTANLVSSEWVLSAERTPEDAAYMSAMESLSLEQKHLRTLYVRLRDPFSRRYYLKYGEEPFLGCPWCQEDSDYLLQVAPSMSLTYIVAFFVLGLAAERRGRHWWRHYINTVLFLLGVFLDCYLYIATEDAGYVVFSGSPPPAGWSLYSFNHKWRNLTLSLLYSVVFYFDEPMETDDDRTGSILDTLSGAHSTLLFTKVQRAAILSDENLRKVVWEDAKRRTVETDVVAADPELEKVRAEAIVKHSLDDAMQKWSVAVDELLDQAARKPHGEDGVEPLE